MSIWLSQGILAGDGIERDVNNPVLVDSSGKRVKKNKATRQQQLARPPNAEKEAQREFSGLLREADKLEVE